MPFQMVNAYQRLAQTGGQGTCSARTDQQSTSQTGAARIRNHIQLRERQRRLRHHLLNQGQDAPNMVATGKLGHHTTIGFVHSGLCMQGLRHQHRQGAARVSTHQSHAGFITRRFNAQYPHGDEFSFA